MLANFVKLRYTEYNKKILSFKSLKVNIFNEIQRKQEH